MSADRKNSCRLTGKTPATLAVHGGEDRSARRSTLLPSPSCRRRPTPFADTRALTDYMEGKDSARSTGATATPTRRAAELKLAAALEGTDDAVAFGSGMAAMTTAILALTKAGAHVVLFNDCYRRTRQFVCEGARALRR